uniref:Sosondowah ankyrin repeat domain family member Ab n=1 Tax=Acanthochromis polyacanthus TaxID=80966 RepID=A0A3Q1ERZ9_9TELE
MALTQESILSFLLEHGGKVRNSELLNNFRSLISCSDPAEKQHNRELFKKLVNSVAVVKQIDEVKFVVVKKRYQDFVKDLTHDVAQKTQLDCSFSSQNTSYSSLRGAESARAVCADFENNNVRNHSSLNGNFCGDAKCAPSESVRKNRQLSRSVSSADTTTVRVLNISGDQASRAGRSGAVFAVIAVKSPQRASAAAAAAAQDGSHPQVHQRISLGSKVSSRSVPALNLVACKKDTLRESQCWKSRQREDTGCPQVRPQSKTTRSADDAKDCESVPLEPLTHEWLVKCAAGLWGQVYALLLRDTRLAQKKDFMSGFTALHWAAKDGNSQMTHEILKVCKKRGTCVDINSKAHGGYTPLHIAAIHGHTDVMLLLVQSYGASVNERDNDGKKAFHYLGKEASAELRAAVGGEKPSREKTEDEEYKEQTKSFNTISKLFQPHMGKKQKTKFAHDW